MKNYIKEARQMAKEHGGTCLSEACRTTKSKIQLECVNGHSWVTTFGNIKYHNQWCKKCVSASQCNTIEDARTIALAKGGNCLSYKYINNHTKMKWRCKNRHVWVATFNKISSGRWCPHCSKKAKLNIIVADHVAEDRNGKCLSIEYINLRSKLTWECEIGHVWSATLNNIKNHGKWCPECKLGKTQMQLSEILKIIYSGCSVKTNYKGFDWLKTIKWYKQEIDIFIYNDYGFSLGIEYDGEQHFRPVRFGGISESEAIYKYQYVQKMDKIKNNKMLLNKSDVCHFIRFNYKDKICEKDVIKKLEANNIPAGL